MRRRVLAQLLVPVVALTGGLLLTACSGGPTGGRGGGTSAPPTSSGPATPGRGEYLPGRPAVVDVVDEPRAVVVIVPGGAWTQIWDPPGFRPLAETLAGAGLAVVQIGYGTAATQSYYPEPADDVACAVAYAAGEVPDVPVVLVGHSAGAVLAVLTGLVPRGDDPECPYAPHAADGVVGLAGPYDVERSGIGENLFGVPVDDDPAAWRDGDPYTWVGERVGVPFLLVHGGADEQLPVSFTRDMGEALADAGHPVRVEVLAGRTHNDLYRADVVADLVLAWVDGTVLAGSARRGAG